MSVVPAHIMRSVGGGYDNESVALTALCLTFYLWCRALRNEKDSALFGVLAGLAYINMAAAWGGYVFVLNLVGVHASLLVFMGRYSTKLYRAYTLFFVIGTLGAMQIPVIGTTPLRSFEQMGPLLAFFGMQILEFCAWQRRRLKLSFWQAAGFLLTVCTCIAVVAALWRIPCSRRAISNRWALERALSLSHTRRIR